MNPHIRTEASEWFVSFRFDDADAAARERFGEWLRRSPEHIQAYLEISGVWAALPRQDPEGQIDVAALVSRARAASADIVPLGAGEQRLPQLNFDTPRVKAGAKPGAGPRRPALRRTLLAACIALASALALTTAWLALSRDPTYATEIGERRSLTLTDGSTVELNARTRMDVHFSETERTIELISGQALFTVAPDAARPFSVRAGRQTVTALGTEFDVYRKGDRTVVTVIQGRVAVVSDMRGATALAPVNLDAGEQAVVTPQAPVAPRRADVRAATAWLQKKLVFDGTPLADVADEFNRYNTRVLIVEDPQLGTLAISGIYSSTDPTSLLRFLRDQPGIVIVESDKEVRISRTTR